MCNKAKIYIPDGNHGCNRHWAFALFKDGQTAKSIKKIKKAIMLEPEDADNWVVWGLIMRTVGYYKQAQHKFERALRIDPENQTAKFELEILAKIIELDEKISVD